MAMAVSIVRVSGSAGLGSKRPQLLFGWSDKSSKDSSDENKDGSKNRDVHHSSSS
jgi:hypothetical protein